ncbi:MAG TPA: EutN/CcmL family microcompartment protein [Bacteroidales bacterium]|nr:EutN/CcmL family microcompartment protein [Bacteroidales bacterium]
MKLGKVIGRVVSTKKVEMFEGLKLALIQPIDENLAEYGYPFVAVDTIQSNVGQVIYYETSKEAGMVLESIMNPCDAAIVGHVDCLNMEGLK